MVIFKFFEKRKNLKKNKGDEYVQMIVEFCRKSFFIKNKHKSDRKLMMKYFF